MYFVTLDWKSTEITVFFLKCAWSTFTGHFYENFKEWYDHVSSPSSQFSVLNKVSGRNIAFLNLVKRLLCKNKCDTSTTLPAPNPRSTESVKISFYPWESRGAHTEDTTWTPSRINFGILEKIPPDLHVSYTVLSPFHALKRWELSPVCKVSCDFWTKAVIYL